MDKLPAINEGTTIMSVTTAFAFVLTVAILAGLTAWAIYWLAGRNNRQIRLEDIAYLLDNHHAAHDHPHHHDDSYALNGHNHDEDYSSVNHDHDGRYAPNQHSHQEYVTRDELNRRVRWNEIVHTVFVDSADGILYGILFGGVIGALVGVILDITLPRRFFETHATTTFHVNGQDIVQHLTTRNAWPMFGIPLGCIVVGMLLGGLALWVFRAIRNRRQSI